MRDATKGSVTYEVETVFAEDAAMSSPLWRLPHLGELDLSGIVQARQDSTRLVQRRNERTGYILGPMMPAFTLRMHITGRGSALDELSVLMGYDLGIAEIGAADTTAGADWDANDGTIGDADVFDDGAIVWFADADCLGQPSVVATNVGTQADLLIDLPAAPSNGTVIYGSDMIYTPESHDHASQKITGRRFLLQTASQQVLVHGVYAAAVRHVGTSPRGLLVYEVDYKGAWFEDVDETFPNAEATSELEPLPNAMGDVFLAPVGTGTRSKTTPPAANDTIRQQIRDITIEHTLGIAEQTGYGAQNAFQSVTEVKRIPDTIIVTIVEDAEDATTAPYLAGLFDANTPMHLLIPWTIGDGKQVADYFPRLYWCGDRPKLVTRDGIRCVEYQLCAGTGPTNTTEMTSSAWRRARG